MQSIKQHIQTTMQDIYRKALDADAKLDSLQKQQQGNFDSVFADDAGFTTRAKRFLPYVKELTAEFETLSALSDEDFAQTLPSFVAKMEVMLRTLGTLKTV